MTKLIQKELQQLWRFENELRAARKKTGQETTIRNLLDEIDTIRLMTKSDRLRRQCAAILAEGSGVATVAGSIA